MPKKKSYKYYQRPDGLYETIRRINGKRVAFRGRTPTEVENKMIAYQGQQQTGRPFNIVAQEWSRAHFPTLEYNTTRGYSPALDRAIEHFGKTLIKEIKPLQIQSFLQSLAYKKFAQKTVTNQRLVLNLIFTYAIVVGDIEFNPCTSVSIPKGLKKERRMSASKQDEEIIKKSADIWLFPCLILYSGLRKGEALALTYEDIQDDYIHVTKSIYHDTNRPKIKTPKTEAGRRVVPLLTPLKEVLPKGKPNCYLFSEDGGKSPLTEKQYQKRWKTFSETTGIKCTAHQLRHSFATMLFEYNIDAKDAQDLLGHAQLSTTLDTYTHIRDSRRTVVAQALNKAIFEEENKKKSEDPKANNPEA